MKMTITILVISHLIATLWHGDAHSTLEIHLPMAKTLFVLVVILAAPIVGAVLAWTRFTVIGLGLIAISMAGAFVFGAYHHYVMVSPDNVAHLPAGRATAHAQFIESAALIASIELLSAFLGFLVLGYAYAIRKRSS